MSSGSEAVSSRPRSVPPLPFSGAVNVPVVSAGAPPGGGT
jgi:hypothetical protein